MQSGQGYTQKRNQLESIYFPVEANWKNGTENITNSTWSQLLETMKTNSIEQRE